jgi:hypothetical protein
MDLFHLKKTHTATIMAGFVATLAGTEMNIWTPVGFVPNPVTCVKAPRAPPAQAERPRTDSRNLMLFCVEGSTGACKKSCADVVS